MSGGFLLYTSEKCGSSILFCKLNCFWYIDQTHHERVSTKARDTLRTCCGFTVVSAVLLPDRIRSRPNAHRTHRQLKCSAALAHSHCLRRFYHARTVAECKYPFPTFIAYFTSALCETRDVIARLSRHRASLGWYGSPPHHRKQRNSWSHIQFSSYCLVFNCSFQVTYLYHFCCVIYIQLYHITRFGEEWAGSLNLTLLAFHIQL